MYDSVACTYFHLCESLNHLIGADERRNSASGIFGGKSDGSYPFHSPAGADDAKFLVEAIRTLQLLKLCQYARPVLGVYQLTVRGWIGIERIEGEFTDLFKCRAHIGAFLSLRVHNPEYFLDVFGHLSKSFLRFA